MLMKSEYIHVLFVCPKAPFGFRRSDPFELKLFEAQDQCDIRAHTKFQLLKCRWSLMTMGQSRGILCGEKVFCALEVEVEGEDQCAREKKVGAQPRRCV